MIDGPTYLNPFRPKASEDIRDTFAFLRNFGIGALDLLPETRWRRPLVIRSAPGGGKTSLMRLFSAESLALVHRRRDNLDRLAERLTELGALGSQGPRVLGIRLGLDQDYRTLLDLDLPEETASRLFFRLLDSRIVIGAVSGALLAAGSTDLTEADRVRFEPIGAPSEMEGALTQLAGPDGDQLLARAMADQNEIRTFLDSLLPIAPRLPESGHHELYALRLMSNSRLLVDGRALEWQPLLMFDDGHALGPSQREGLLGQLFDRRWSVPRWYAERYEALNSQELIAGDSESRDYDVIKIEGESSKGGGRIRFERFFQDVGDRRAGQTLSRYGWGGQSFTELLGDRSTPVEAPAEVMNIVRDAALASDKHGTYAEWMSRAASLDGTEALAAWREIPILIAKHRGRQLELFDLPATGAEAERLAGSAVREAARLFVSKDYRLPYYWGPETLAKVGGKNVEQYLGVGGDLFEVMLTQLVLGREPLVSPRRQHNVIRQASKNYWDRIPRRVPHGRDVRRLVAGMTSLAVRETYRPTAPYAPGVTGIAITHADRNTLIDPSRRAKIPQGERLFNALGSAIAFWVVAAEPEHLSKGREVMVLYLNRLLCPRAWLPLSYGGFRACTLTELATWVSDPGLDEAPSVELGLDLA